MKLYATTTSERASKGQGGHEELYVLLQCKNEITGLYDEVGKVKMEVSTGGAVNLVFRSLVSEQDMIIQLPERYNKKVKSYK